jgi:hypothetical protein
VARILAEEGPYPRSILFVAFSGEERGLLGSAHYTANAAVPLSTTLPLSVLNRFAMSLRRALAIPLPLPFPSPARKQQLRPALGGELAAYPTESAQGP